MIKEIENKRMEIYVYIDREGKRIYRIEDMPWGSGGKFYSEEEYERLQLNQDFNDICNEITTIEGRIK